jgi:N-methylhydantoinase A
MANASRVHAAEYGKDLRKRTLVAFGGAAPLHAARLASKLNLSTIVIPLGAGVGSAIGFLQAPIAYEVVRSHHVRLADDDLGELESLLAEMGREARAIVAGAAGASAVSLKGTAFMRYVGQGHDLQIDLPDDPASAVKQPGAFAAVLASRFAESYRSIFGRSLDRHPVEVLTWTMTATVAMAPEGPGVEFRSPSGRPEPVGEARLYDFEAGALQDAPIYWRATLPEGFHIDGPAIVAEEETSTVVSAGFGVSVHPLGHLILTAKSTASVVSE